MGLSQNSCYIQYMIFKSHHILYKLYFATPHSIFQLLFILQKTKMLLKSIKMQMSQLFHKKQSYAQINSPYLKRISFIFISLINQMHQNIKNYNSTQFNFSPKCSCKLNCVIFLQKIEIFQIFFRKMENAININVGCTILQSTQTLIADLS